MKFVRYRTGDGVRTGAIEGETITDLNGASVTGLLSLDPDTRADEVGKATDAGQGEIDLADVVLDSPIERPGKFIGLGFNFADHANEHPVEGREDVARVYETIRLTRQAYPDSQFPILFNKQTTCICGPHDDVLLPSDVEMLDYEGELAIVIGKRGRRLSESDAMDAIAGYTVTNDLSIRDWQVDTQTMWPGKSFDTHGPLGPCVVTADALDPSALAIRTWINGELRQNSSTEAMIIGVAKIVSIISQLCTLEPGDVIATGTPAGIGTPTGRFMQVGDVMRVEVEGIGTIQNTIVPEEA